MGKQTKLIVLAAFNKDDEGNLLQAFDPKQMDTEEKAKREARMIADKHAAVVAWSREADPNIGEYGPPVVLFQAGEIPDLE